MNAYVPIPACPTIQDIRMKSITPQMFSMQRIFNNEKHKRLRTPGWKIRVTTVGCLYWSTLQLTTETLDHRTNQDSFHPSKLDSSPLGLLCCSFLRGRRLFPIRQTVFERILIFILKKKIRFWVQGFMKKINVSIILLFAFMLLPYSINVTGLIPELADGDCVSVWSFHVSPLFFLLSITFHRKLADGGLG